MTGKVFISYRRAESHLVARHLATLLENAGFKDNVFIDIKGLDGSSDWLHAIEKEVASSEALLSLISKGWEDVRDEDGKRRLDSERDQVRYEIAEALRREIPVIPVLIDRAQMPTTRELPDNIMLLTRPQAEFLREESFDSDVAKISERLKKEILKRRPPPPPPPPPPSLRLVALAATASLVVGLLSGVTAGPTVWETAGLGSIGQTQNKSGNEVKQLRQDLSQRTSERDEARQQVQSFKVLAEGRSGEIEAAKKTIEAAKNREKTVRGELEGRIAAAEQLRKNADEARDRAVTSVKALEQANLLFARRLEEATKSAPVPIKPPAPPPKVVGKSAQVMRFGDKFQDCPVCPDMIVVPAGTFVMGSPDSELERRPNEGPRRNVTFASPFAVGRFEVSFLEWDACVEEGGCKIRPNDEGWGRGKMPVMRISWDDIKQQYLPWLGRKTGKSYRLLTEAEWEYVARAGSKTAFAGGDKISGERANFATPVATEDGKAASKPRRTMPVDTLLANDWGLHHTSGNVWEWVEDCYADNYEGAPINGSAARETPGCRRVLRGGSYANVSRILRSARRSSAAPSYANLDQGFRVALTLP